MAARLRLRFRTKIWIVLCGLTAAALAVARDAALRSAHAESRARFDRTLAAFHELQRLRARWASAEIDSLSAANPQLRTILSTATLAGADLSLAEELPPEVVVAHLNEYFDAVCGAVLEEDGTVKEFQGDGVVCFWGAPIPQHDHAARASRAALVTAARLERLRGVWEARGPSAGPARQGVAAPGYRLGLHSAELVAGEIGSGERGAYGIVGDGMNLAARIESANKLYGTRVLVSEQTRAALSPAFLLREIDHVRVVGRRQPVRLFELVALAAAADSVTRRACESYERALGAYRERAFAESLRILDELLASAPEDGPARVLRARVSELLRSPPAPEWDAIVALETK